MRKATIILTVIMFMAVALTAGIFTKRATTDPGLSALTLKYDKDTGLYVLKIKPNNAYIPDTITMTGRFPGSAEKALITFTRVTQHGKDAVYQYQVIHAIKQ